MLELESFHVDERGPNVITFLASEFFPKEKSDSLLQTVSITCLYIRNMRL